MKTTFTAKSVALITLFVFGCTHSTSITESEVIKAINNFFSALDVEKFDRNRVADLVTNDFRIYEMENDFTLEQFFEYVDSQSQGLSATSWELSNYTVSIDEHSAHVHYSNKGEFVMTDDKGNEKTLHIEWLESAYFVQENGVLKLKFLHSDDITKENSTDSEQFKVFTWNVGCNEALDQDFDIRKTALHTLITKIEVNEDRQLDFDFYLASDILASTPMAVHPLWGIAIARHGSISPHPKGVG